MIVEGGGLMWVTIESLCCTIEANVICYLKNILVKIHIKTGEIMIFDIQKLSLPATD